MDHLRADIRFAIRSLLRRPGFAMIAVVTLGLGIGATTAIFSVVHGVLVRSLPFREADRIVELWSTDRRSPGPPVDGSASPVTVEEWRTRSSSFEAMAAWARTRPTLTGMGEPEIVLGAAVTPDFFRVFGAEPALGRGFTADEARPQGPLSVVVSDGFWRDRLGGRRDVLGSVLELNGRTLEVIGVAPAGFEFPAGSRLWLALRNDPQECGHGCVFVNVVGRLAPGVPLERARAELRGIADQLSAEFPGNLTNGTIGAATLQETTVGDVRPALLMLLAAVGMVLLIACANVANLLVARGATRTDEMALRVALGAGRRRLVSQLLMESFVLALAGGALGVALGAVGVNALRSLEATGIPRLDEVGIDGSVIAFALALVLLTTLLFGLVPALRLAVVPIAGALRQDATRTVGGRRGLGRSALLAAEVALSLVLLVGAGLLLRSFASMQRVDPGYRIADVVRSTVSLPSARYPAPDDAVRFFDELERRLEALPGVEAATRSVGAPLSAASIWTSFDRPDRPPPAPGEGSSAGLRPVGHDFFDVMDVQVVRGRAFEASDRQGAVPVAIVNSTLAEAHFAGEDPVGRSIDLGLSIGYPETGSRTIVGVVEDVLWERIAGGADPEIFVPHAQTGSSSAAFLIRTGSASAAIGSMRKVVQELDPALPVRDPGTMQELFDGHTARSRFYLFVLAIFASLAIALAAVGLYGVVSYLVAQRRRELGLRMALGASRSDVLRLVMRQGLLPAAAGAAIGLAAAVAVSRWIGALLFGITPTDPLTLAATTALLMAIVAAACALPATRATRIPPANALKSEG